MTQAFPYTFRCDVCGGEFYSKVDPSSWRTHKCNKCSGKQYKDYPVKSGSTTYSPKPVPTTKQVYNNVQPVQVEKKEFNVEAYIEEMLYIYLTLKNACDRATLTIPEENLCNWTTSIMIQRGKQ